jgi:xanthine dehydrogenase YagS FAD-binding subunit
MSGYARPASLDEALALLEGDGAVPFGGGTDLAGQVDRGIRSPAQLVDLRDAGLGGIEAHDGGIRIGASVPLADLAASPLVEPFAAVRTAASLAASPLLRNVGTVGGNLCQHTRCWYYRGAEWHCWLGGGETCYAQIGDHRKHGLEPGDCISAHPSDLAPALAACGAIVELRSLAGARELPLLDLYRRPTAENRSLVVLDPGELVVAARLPDPPDSSAYERLGERAAFSFPLVAVAAARRGEDIRLVAAGVANTPRELDPSDPLSGLPGNPQSTWKRRALETLAERALAAVR